MTISQLISALEKVERVHGDLPVYVSNEPDTIETECTGVRLLEAEEPDPVWEEIIPEPKRVYIKN